MMLDKEDPKGRPDPDEVDRGEVLADPDAVDEALADLADAVAAHRDRVCARLHRM